MENSALPSPENSASSAREKLSSYLGNQMKVVISDGRVLIGEFMCTDKERNLILGNCDEYIPMNNIEEDINNKQEGLSRMLSLAIIPGRHISSIAVAKGKSPNEPLTDPSSLKHQNQCESQHEGQHEREGQHKNHKQIQDQNQCESQHEGQHEREGQHKNHKQIQDQNQWSQCEQQNQKDQSMNQHEDQHKDHNKNQHSKEHESKGTENTTDACTEEHGQTEDFHTPEKHLTLQ